MLSPGLVAYDAYCTSLYGVHAHPDDYHTLSWGQRQAWDAAAQAVLAQAAHGVDGTGFVPPGVSQPRGPQEPPPRRWTPQPLVLDLDPDVQREDTPWMSQIVGDFYAGESNQQIPAGLMRPKEETPP